MAVQVTEDFWKTDNFGEMRERTIMCVCTRGKGREKERIESTEYE